MFHSRAMVPWTLASQEPSGLKTHVVDVAHVALEQRQRLGHGRRGEVEEEHRARPQPLIEGARGEESPGGVERDGSGRPPGSSACAARRAEGRSQIRTSPAASLMTARSRHGPTRRGGLRGRGAERGVLRARAEDPRRGVEGVEAVLEHAAPLQRDQPGAGRVDRGSHPALRPPGAELPLGRPVQRQEAHGDRPLPARAGGVEGQSQQPIADDPELLPGGSSKVCSSRPSGIDQTSKTSTPSWTVGLTRCRLSEVKPRGRRCGHGRAEPSGLARVRCRPGRGPMLCPRAIQRPSGLHARPHGVTGSLRKSAGGPWARASTAKRRAGSLSARSRLAMAKARAVVGESASFSRPRARSCAASRWAASASARRVSATLRRHRVPTTASDREQDGEAAAIAMRRRRLVGASASATMAPPNASSTSDRPPG